MDVRQRAEEMVDGAPPAAMLGELGRLGRGVLLGILVPWVVLSSGKSVIDHVSAIADPDVRDQYRGEWLRRFDDLYRARRQEWRGRPPAGRFAPHRPTSPETKAVGRTGLAEAPTRATLRTSCRMPRI